MTKSHARFGSPSMLSALEKCPGRIAYTKDMSPLSESEYAKEGTEFHKVMENLCIKKFKKGCTLNDKICMEYNVSIYPDMGETAYDSMNELLKLYQSFWEKHTDIHTEFELKIKVNDDIFGTSDVVFTGKNKKTGKTDVVCIDWKYGQGVRVTAEENLQGIAYGLGAIKTLKIQDVGTCVVIIAQVRLEDGWSRFDFSGSDIKKYEDKINSIVKKVKDVYDGRLNVLDNLHSGSHCRFCPANGICVAQKKDLIDPLVDAVELDVLEKVQQMTLDEQVAVFLKKKAIENMLDAIAGNLNKAMQAGIEHPALKLVQTNGRRRWKDKDTVGEILQERGIDDPYKHTPIGVVEAEKLLGKPAIEDLTEVGEGKIELVSVNDKRPALLISKLEELE